MFVVFYNFIFSKNKKINNRKLNGVKNQKKNKEEKKEKREANIEGKEKEISFSDHPFIFVKLATSSTHSRLD